MWAHAAGSGLGRGLGSVALFLLNHPQTWTRSVCPPIPHPATTPITAPYHGHEKNDTTPVGKAIIGVNNIYIEKVSLGPALSTLTFRVKVDGYQGQDLSCCGAPVLEQPVNPHPNAHLPIAYIKIFSAPDKYCFIYSVF